MEIHNFKNNMSSVTPNTEANRHFEFFVSLWGEPETQGVRHSEKLKNIGKVKRLGSSIVSFWGHILRRLPLEVESATVFSRFFVSLF